MKKIFKSFAGAVAASLVTTAAFAAGAGTGIEAGFTEVGTDLQTLLGGAGGFIIMIVALAFGAVMLAIGRGWGAAVTAFAVALVIGYGFDAVTSLAGVTATTDMVLASTAHPTVAGPQL